MPGRMGLEIERDRFDADDRKRFAARLCDSLQALEILLARPGFGEGPASLGAELELDLVDGDERPLLCNRQVLAATLDPRVTLELDRFNLELNTHPVPLAGAPFSALARELDDALRATARAAAIHGGRVVTIGILPTLTERDLRAPVLTDSPRYRALSAGIRQLRRDPFRVQIDGDDPLSLDVDDVTCEGANTSFQIHLRVAPAAFARTYNAAQLATGAALALAGNSPFFVGRRLWEETRIALFRQAVDDRRQAHEDDWRPARVSFGHGWVLKGAHELFAEAVALHTPLVPLCAEEDPLACVRAGGVPSLRELRLHHGTVWRWNRSVYDPVGGGHLRIELRALPAGPTVIDMMANAAFAVGLTLGLAPTADQLIHRITFGHARRNFYQAARFGLEAELLWPAEEPPSPRPLHARELLPRLLPVARRGLVDGGVDPDEADRLLTVVAARVAAGRTGARWQRQALEAARGALCPFAALLREYRAHSSEGRPVHEWPWPTASTLAGG
jgi:hypothetical protein